MSAVGNEALSVTVSVRLESSTASDCSEWMTELAPGAVVELEVEVEVAAGVGFELDLAWRSRKGTLD